MTGMRCRLKSTRRSILSLDNLELSLPYHLFAKAPVKHRLDQQYFTNAYLSVPDQELAAKGGKVTVTGAALFGQTQPPLAPELMLVTGGTVQCGLGVQACEVIVLVPATLSAFTRTGMTAPVLREKVRCPRTLNIEAISPE